MPAPALKTDFLFWQLPIKTLLEQLAASPDGLSSADACLRLTRYGPNLIHGEQKKALLLQFLTKYVEEPKTSQRRWRFDLELELGEN